MFLTTLGINKVYLDPTHDRCYCESCGSHIPKVLEYENDTSPYEVPHGWCGFGLKLPPKAEDLQIFEWCVTYHGCPAKFVPSILAEGSLLMPGDQLLDGTKLPNRLTRGGKDRIQLYTSPSVLYSELDIYTKPVQFQGSTVRIVLQCRQKPGFDTCKETIGWERKYGKVPISSHFSNKIIERFTKARGSIIPYRILIKKDSHTREMEEEIQLRKKQGAIKAQQEAQKRQAQLKRQQEAARLALAVKVKATITIRVKDLTGEETYFTVKLSTRMEKVFNVYAQRKGVDAGTLRFLRQGRRFDGDQTAESLGLKDQDTIDCLLRDTFLKSLITIRVKDLPGEETYFKVKMSTRMEKVFSAYAQRQGVDAGTLRFLRQGRRFDGDQTAESLGLKDQDIIDCLLRDSFLKSLITIRVKDLTGEETYFKVKMSTRMEKVFSAYAQRKGVDAGALRFLRQGRCFDGDQTAESLGLKDQDIIDCLLRHFYRVGAPHKRGERR
jgi:small ubiquitin-related modifier